MKFKISQEAQFKRLSVGAFFTHSGVRFRKTGKSSARRYKSNGRGETHAPVAFARSTTVLLDPAISVRV